MCGIVGAVANNNILPILVDGLRRVRGLGAVILGTAFITIVAMIDPSGLRAPGMAEGCIGSPALFIAAAAAICVAIVFRTKPPERGANGSEN